MQSEQVIIKSRRLSFSLILFLSFQVVLIILIATGNLSPDPSKTYSLIGTIGIILAFESLFLVLLIQHGHYLILHSNKIDIKNQWLKQRVYYIELTRITKIRLIDVYKSGYHLLIVMKGGKTKRIKCGQIPYNRFSPLKEYLAKNNIEFEAQYKL